MQSQITAAAVCHFSLSLDECFGKDVTKEVKNIINFSVDNKIKQLEAELEAINTPSRKKRA